MEDGADPELSDLACYSCKRRKVKCNRLLPVCSLCTRLGSTCQYPSHSGKPGPKIGSTHKNKRRRLHTSRSPTWATSQEERSVDLHQNTFERSSISSQTTTLQPGGTTGSFIETQTPDLLNERRDRTSRSPVQQRLVADDRNENASSAPTFSQIMFPSHEAQTRGPSPSPREITPARQAMTARVTVETVCEGLKISRHLYDYLMESYFCNMTSFTLFKPHAIEPKLASMRSSAEAEALVAAMFSYSARFHSSYRPPGRPAECPAPEYFARITSAQLDKALDQYSESLLPFCLLQAYVLMTFYQLTRSVQSKSWRTLGSCIRLAYDMNLHLIDANHHGRNSEAANRPTNVERWSILEERRRAWWAIWEMDVFASTIRRLPMAIDWSQNFTLLPVPDACWFNNIHQESCYLVLDPNLRWKRLSNSGNTSARAWFIIINSFMCNAQLIVYSPGSTRDSTSESSQADLNVIANCLFCASNSLPPDISYHGETLDFRTKDSPDDINCHQFHSDKYSIHLMTQLVRFMFYHHKVCAQAPWLSKPSMEDHGPSRVSVSAGQPSWSNYMDAAQEIVTIARNSASDHYKYVNPFLTNTLWFAAAAQIAYRVVGPPSGNRQLAESNYELLALVIDRFIAFWNIMDMLQRRLARLEAGLKSLMTGEGREGEVVREHNAEDARGDLPSVVVDAMSTHHQPSSTDPSQASHAGAADMDPTVLPFLPMLYGNMGPSTLADPLFFQDPGQFFPYGVGDLWMWNKAPQI